MSKLNLKEAKKKVNKIELENTKLMWQYANWQWKIIIILGIIFLVKIVWEFGIFLGRLIR